MIVGVYATRDDANVSKRIESATPGATEITMTALTMISNNIII